jgi:gamma-glutamylcyclotransferase (GGCT)/AIG2-like uncharacterized protein YtfP
MPLIFAYGTLQDAPVQQAIYGRALQGCQDELNGAERRVINIEDPQVVAATGRASHANIEFNGRPESRVSGTLLELTDAELDRTDEYERRADYMRIEVQLASGTTAWTYVYWPSHARA